MQFSERMINIYFYIKFTIHQTAAHEYHRFYLLLPDNTGL